MKEVSILKLIRKELVFLSILALILLNFSGESIYWCYLTVPLFLFYIYHHVNIIDVNFSLLLAYSIIYSASLLLNNANPGSKTVFFGYLLFPFIFYYLGKLIINKYPQPETIYFLLFFICIFMSLLPFFANIQSTVDNGFMTIRNIRLLWMEEGGEQNATNVGSYFALSLSLLPLILVQQKTKTERRYAWLGILLVSIGLFSILNMSNRTGLLIVLLSLLCATFLLKRKKNAVLFIVIILAAVLILYIFNILGFQTWFEYSTYHERLSTASFQEEGRIGLWTKALYGIIKYPLGNASYMPSSYAHNLWLDTALRTGLIPMALLLIIAVRALISIYKQVRNQAYPEFMRIMIAGITVAFYLTFMLEPIMEGYYIFFFVFCFFFGILEGFSNKTLHLLNN